jgi:thymidine phosphorylase
MSTKKAVHKAEAKEVLGAVIKGDMAFQRTGQVVTFKAADERIVSNPVVQFPVSVLPADYAPEKYEVTGTFEYRINVKAK